MTADSFSSLKLAQWPEQDRLLWLAAREPGDFFDDAGLAADWRPATVVNVEYHYGTFLWWLRTMGRLDEKAKPVDRANAVNIHDFIHVYSVDHAQSSVAAVVHVIGDLVRVTSPEADIPWIANLARRIKRKARPQKPTAQRRSPLIHLIRLGDMLMDRGQATLIDDAAAGALMFRDGLMIVTEVALPLRRKNIASLRLGASLFRDGSSYRVKFTGDEMKNGQDFEGRYPDSLTSALNVYFDTIRPILRAGSKSEDDGSVWLGHRGEPMIGASISLRLRELTQRHVGVPFAAHSFRHSAATDIALLDPKHVGIVKSVLGHASPLSGDYYNLASGFEAASRYQALLADLRRNDRDT